MYASQPSAPTGLALSAALMLWASTALPAHAQGPAVDPDGAPPPGGSVAAAEEAEGEETVAESGTLDRGSMEGREPCLQPPVEVARIFGPHREESAQLQLTHCDGRPNASALDELTLLARPLRLARPPAGSAGGSGDLLAEGIRRLDPELLTRLQAIADRFPGKRIEIVSGYRPRARRTSRHHHGRALDLRVVGVERNTVSQFARSLPETGVGYYPNSTFTHVDVRGESTYWVDRSAPGERPDYGSWPPGGDEMERTRERVLAIARSALGRLARAAEGSLGAVTGPAASGAGAIARGEPPERVDGVPAEIPVTAGDARQDDEPEDEAPLGDAELAALRASWQQAIRGLAAQ